MIRWVFAIFLGLTIFYPLLPDILARLRVGRWPGDFLFQFRGSCFAFPSARLYWPLYWSFCSLNWQGWFKRWPIISVDKACLRNYSLRLPAEGWPSG